MAIFGLLCALIICILFYMIFSGGTGELSGIDGTDGQYIRQELPDGVPEIMPDRKSESYKDKRNISTEEYFDMLGDNEEDISLVSEERHTETDNPTEIQDGESAVERLFGLPPEAENRSSETDRPSPFFGSETVVMMAPEEKLEYDRKRAEMVKDVIIGSENTDTGYNAEETEYSENQEKPTIDFGKADNGDEIISSLDDIDIDNTSNDVAGIRHPFKCMFVKSQKIHDGERIRIRLLEDYNADGISIPANTHLTAICKIGKRLELSVLSIQMNGIWRHTIRTDCRESIVLRLFRPKVQSRLQMMQFRQLARLSEALSETSQILLSVLEPTLRDLLMATSLSV